MCQLLRTVFQSKEAVPRALGVAVCRRWGADWARLDGRGKEGRREVQNGSLLQRAVGGGGSLPSVLTPATEKFPT